MQTCHWSLGRDIRPHRGHRALGWCGFKASACQPRLEAWKPDLALSPDRQILPGALQRAVSLNSPWRLFNSGPCCFGGLGGRRVSAQEGERKQVLKQLELICCRFCLSRLSPSFRAWLLPSGSRKLSLIALAFGSLLVHLQDCSSHCLLFLLVNMLTTLCVGMERGCP